MVAPEILWAQRSSDFDADKNIIFLTISVPELDPSYKLEIASSQITFSGHSTPPAATATASKVEPKTYDFDLTLFGEVEELKRTLTGKNLSLVLKKKELSEDYWPRLTKEKVKLNFVKTDFGKWKDQDEQEDEEEPEEAPQGPPGGGMEGMMGGMGGMGGAGGAGGMDFASMMAGMGGGGAGGAGGMDFEKMMAQMKASGMGGLGDDEEGGEAAPEEEDSDDDGPPPLEPAA